MSDSSHSHLLNVFFAAILISGAAGSFGVRRLYPPEEPPVPFPRSPSEFRSPALLEAAKARAFEVLARHPDDLGAHVDLVLAFFEEGPGEYVKGLEYLERARDLGALDERLFYYAGIMYESQNLPDYAIPEFEKFVRRRPDDLEARLRLANLYFRVEEWDKSIEAYKGLLAQQPGDLMVSYNMATVYREMKKWPEGLEALKPFTQGGRTLPSGGHRLVGDLMRGVGNPQQALEEYKKEQSTNGDSMDLVVGMALAAEALGNNEFAVERWKKALLLDPGSGEARAHLRRLNKISRTRRR